MDQHGPPQPALAWGAGWGAERGDMKKLTAIGVKNAPDGVLRDGGGLSLEKKGETGKWVYRYSHLKKRREMGLGQWPTISLGDARKSRDQWALVLATGVDPITEREAQRTAMIEERDKSDPTLTQLVETVFDARVDMLRGGGERGRWKSPLVKHILPRIGGLPVSRIDRHEIAAALKPIWRTKHPTAIKALRRIHIILRDGESMGYSARPNEAEAAKRILGQVLHRPTPIAATPWQDVPALYARLGDSASADCLRFIILTVMRTHACAGARFDEIKDGVWTVPADRMKATVATAADFRVPLSQTAIEIVERRQPFSQGGLIFETAPGRGPSTTALEQRLNSLNEAGRPHGFRTSFRTWVQDTDACGWDVSETALGHAIGKAVERSYARSDLLDRRRVAMNAWAAFVTGAQSNIVQMTNPKGKG